MFASSLAPHPSTSQAPATATLWLLGVLGFAAGAFAALGGPHAPVRSAAVAMARAEPSAVAGRTTVAPAPSRPPAPRLAGLPAPRPTPAPPKVTRDARSTRKQLVALALLVALAGVAWIIARQRKVAGPGGGALRGLEVIQTLRLGGRFQVALVRAPGRLLVLGLSDKGVTLLTELDDEDLPALAADFATLGAQGHAAQAAAAPGGSSPGASPGAGVAASPFPPGPPPDAARAAARRADGRGEEAFLDTLMDRLSSATPSVIREVLGAHRPGSPNASGAAQARGRARGLQRYEQALAP